MKKKTLSKTRINITIDFEVAIALQQKPHFNISEFCNESLRKALDVKETDIPGEEKDLDISIAENRIKLQMLERKKDELVDIRKKEEKRWTEAP